MTTRRYRITGMHCASCGLLVDETLEDLPGIASSSTDVRAGSVIVEVQPDASPEHEDRAVVTAVTALGYGCQPES